MQYLILIELESVGFTSCKIQGLCPEEHLSLERRLTQLNVTSIKQDTFFEVDTQGVIILNILGGNDYNYNVVSQSMAIEKTSIGGRTIQVQKTVWTLYKNTCK